MSKEKIKFQYPKDRDFFSNLLAGSNVKKLYAEFPDYFDFRHPAIKRWEFNKNRKKILIKLVSKYKKKCQLQIHPDCSINGKFEPDHIIPLATNELNKKIRHMTMSPNSKVPAQSFGSNNLKNLTLACKRCNAFKKHRIILPFLNLVHKKIL